jgi:hypothetical protein
MKVRGAFRSAAAASVVMGLIAPASAGAVFDPTIQISLSTRQTGANPRIDFSFVQDAGEEAVDELTFNLPRRFRIPRDASIATGENLGQGKLTTGLTPLCSAAFQGTFDAILYERDRTAEEIQQGLWAVWVADLGPVEVVFPWTRLASGRWRAITDIPRSPLVCPPVTLNSTVNKTSAESGTVISRNPRKPGTYTVRFIAWSVEGSRHEVKQRIKFTKPRR